MATTQTADTRVGAIAIAVAPAVMFASLVAHPYLVRLPDAAAVAEAVQGSTTRWGVVHLLTTVGSALVAVAFMAIRTQLREAGEERFSGWALPFVVIGSALYGVLPGLELAPMAAARTDGDAAAVQAALEPWFVAILVSSVIIFATGVFGFVRAIAASRILGRPLTQVVVWALVILALSRFIPLGAVQFYAQAVAGLVGLWPLAYQSWRGAQGARVAQSSSSPVPSA